MSRHRLIAIRQSFDDRNKLVAVSRARCRNPRLEGGREFLEPLIEPGKNIGVCIGRYDEAFDLVPERLHFLGERNERFA